MTTIGVFTDLHYAKDINSKYRYCSLSLIKLEKIIAIFNEGKIDFAVCLGDSIDSMRGGQEDMKDLVAVRDCLKGLDAPLHIVMGNHDVRSMSKNEFLQTIQPGSKNSYYSFVSGRSKFIVLDANNSADGPYDSGNFNWREAYIDEGQKSWFAQELEAGEIDNVVVFVHQNLDERFIDGEIDPHVVANASEIREIMERSSKAISVIAGHCHAGHDQVINGIRYYTQRAVCEGEDTDNIPYVMVNIGDDSNISLVIK